MTPSIGIEPADNNIIAEQQIWQIPPYTRMNYKLSEESNSRIWRYSVLSAGLSAVSSSLSAEQSGEVFAPGLQTLKSRLDALLEQASTSFDSEAAWSGSKREIEPHQGSCCVPSDGAANSTKLKSGQRTFRTSTVRTSTQRRVRFLVIQPETGVDEYVLEPSSSKELDELSCPPLKKNKVCFGGSEVNMAIGAGRQTHVRSLTCGAKEIPKLEELDESNSAFVTPNLIEVLVHEKGMLTSEEKLELESSQFHESRKENCYKASKPGTASSTVTSCLQKTSESRYCTLNLKRPELVTSVETPNKRIRRIADQTIPVFGPTAGHGCAGPVCDRNDSDPTRVAPYCEYSPRPPETPFLEDSLVQDSQEASELEAPAAQKTTKDGFPWENVSNQQQLYVKQSVTAGGPYEPNGNDSITPNSIGNRPQYEIKPQAGRLEADYSSDAPRQGGAAVCRSVRTATQSESVTTIRAELHCRNFWPEPTSIRETGMWIPPNEMPSALELFEQGNSCFDRELRPGCAGSVNFEDPDESGKCQGPDLLSNVFRTGRGNPVQISTSAVNRVISFFNEDSAHPQTRADYTTPRKSTPGAKPLVISPAVADPQSLLFVREPLYAHPLSVPEHGGLKDLEVNRRIPIEDNTACLFQTGRGKAVHISSESMRRARTVFATPVESVVNHRPPPVNGRSRNSSLGREDFLNSGGDKATRRDCQEAAVTTAGPSLSRSSLFRTGRDTPVSISSAALLKIRSIFEDDELHTEAESSKLESKRPPGKAERREQADYTAYQLDKDFGPPALNADSQAVRNSYKPSAFEFGQALRTTLDEGIENETSNVVGPCHRKDTPPEASDWSFSFKGSRGRILRVSSAAKAKAEALLKLGPEFVASSKFEARVPSSEGSVKSSKSATPLAHDAKESKNSAGTIKEARKLIKSDLGPKPLRIDSRRERGTTPAFKSPRLIRPPPNLCDRPNDVGLQSASTNMTRRNYLLPVSLHYLHKRTSRKERGRLSMHEYFFGPPHLETKISSGLPKELLSVSADTAEMYRIPDGISSVGVEDMWMMLKDLGADQRHASEEWIVWKLASYERKFPHQHARLLTLPSVLNELKYRYDRELNGERSALKRVTEKDAAAGHTMVLCVAAVRSVKDVDHSYETWTEKGDNGDGTKRKHPSAGVIEVTDGWYRLNADIDVPLARRIHSGKLKAGQKLVVSGATLEGLSDGLPPLQAYHNAYLCINSNGVRRARWDQRLGFSGTAIPLAFNCVTQDGGVIPHTYVAVTKRYTVLHREKIVGVSRLASGGYILRSSRAEDQAAHDFDQKRAKVAHEVMQKLEYCDNSTDEGAMLCAALETAADPESLLLDMTRIQLDAFAAFKARKEIATGDVIKAALESQGLVTREVVPTFKVRVVGLNSQGNMKSEKEGLVTIWQATEELQELLQEGKVFCVYGLHPSTKGSYHSFNSTRWRSVSGAALDNFRFPYVPRAPLRISKLSEYMSCREFDVTGLVLFVTEPVTRDVFRGRAKSQWVFMTDGSCAKANAADAWEETQVLAIEVSWAEEGFIPLESTLVGSVVGYCNLWLKHRDHSNRLWVAEASDRAHYSVRMTSPAFRHLRSAACEVESWAKLNTWNVDILQSDVEELAVRFRSIGAS